MILNSQLCIYILRSRMLTLGSSAYNSRYFSEPLSTHLAFKSPHWQTRCDLLIPFLLGWKPTALLQRLCVLLRGIPFCLLILSFLSSSCTGTAHLHGALRIITGVLVSGPDYPIFHTHHLLPFVLMEFGDECQTLCTRNS